MPAFAVDSQRVLLACLRAPESLASAEAPAPDAQPSPRR
jgi:hypothetical protein